MNIYRIAKDKKLEKYAIGTPGKLAKYVVLWDGKKAIGVRGRRPKLNDRFEKATPPTAVREAFQAAL